MPETIPGSAKAREAFPARFACDVPPDEGGPPQHKHTGAVYTITPPKSALQLKLAVRTKQFANDPAKLVDGLYEWMDKAFGKEVADELRRRMLGPDDDEERSPAQIILGQLGELPDDVARRIREALDDLPPQDGEPRDAEWDTDDDDPLDIADIMAVMQYVTERVTQLPPT